MKKAIFTYANFQVDERIVTFQKDVLEKFNSNGKYDYQFLRYNAVDPEVVPDQVIDYGLNHLFYELNYDSVLILDIDCIPLNEKALDYSFEKAESGILVGNVQRSNHIDNNKHIYVAPSCICLTKEMFEKLGKLSFRPTNRGDIGEELTYVARTMEVPVEFYIPSKYEDLPYNSKEPWELDGILPSYGIGTTFVNSIDEEMFYHLFQSRINLFNELFYNKCAEILK
jgi:hypothetical protein